MSDQIIEQRELEPVKIDNIHFLIHPGFCTDPDVMDEVDEKGHVLLDKYIEEAKKLNSNELMIVFPHTTLRDLREDFREGKEYAKTLHELKNILKKRMVVVSGNFDLFNSPEAFQKSLSLIKGRGYNFDKTVNTFAYGESLEVCVSDGAENLNKNSGFIKKTIIIPELTDDTLSKPEVSIAVRQRMHSSQNDFPHVSFGNI